MSFTDHPAQIQSSDSRSTHVTYSDKCARVSWSFYRPAATAVLHVRHLLVEARPPVVGIFAVRIIAATDIGRNFNAERFWLVAAWIALTVSVYVFNGLSDLDGDQLNGSTRPLASGRMRRGSALASCAVLAAGSLVMCWWCGAPQGLAATASLALGWAYSAGPSWKASPVGFAVTIVGGAGLTYLAGCWESGTRIGVQMCLVTVAVWVGVCSGAKDFSDIDGDRLAGRRTWPVLFGPRRAAWMVCGLASCAVFVVFTVAADQASEYLPAVGVLVAGTTVYIIALLRMKDGGGRDHMRRPYKAFMLTQFAFNFAFIACGA